MIDGVWGVTIIDSLFDLEFWNLISISELIEPFLLIGYLCEQKNLLQSDQT